MQAEKLPPQTFRRVRPPYRAVKRRPVTVPRRVKTKNIKAILSQLKYKNIFILVAVLMTVSWVIMLPFRGRPVSETLIPTPEFSVSPTLIPPYVPPAPEPDIEDLGFAYNVRRQPYQRYNSQLQEIVDELVNIAEEKGLPTGPLSISLIDVSNQDIHTFAGYQGQVLRYPASVSKLFWMAAFYGAVEEGLIDDESKFHGDLRSMMQKSHNDSASKILDAITDSKSGVKLEGEKLNTWLEKRKSVNEFFHKAGYQGLIVSTKNYPRYSPSQTGPVGRDRQLRKENGKFLRNLISTDHASRLMYEIYTRQAVSPKFSTRMAYLLTRDLTPEVWQNDPYNGVKGFLAESLPPSSVYFGSKVGFTSKHRMDVAFVRTLDDRAIYILAIFAEDAAYATDEEIFPKLSRHVYDRMMAMGRK
ncbi:MAG: serine hydrolase [Okeania sp. SIO3I5]|uniref:serine hydrolase n=1 Tax=Okeania sp. SIO3I5 TaxID=2607805 RepID=UPI0013B6D830|nr:serine hydrolase [Okeania sp. SIO3I5]NEQ40374.1 serine hydrolase [Okeania sp. SIO3I5]